MVRMVCSRSQRPRREIQHQSRHLRRISSEGQHNEKDVVILLRSHAQIYLVCIVTTVFDQQKKIYIYIPNHHQFYNVILNFWFSPSLFWYKPYDNSNMRYSVLIVYISFDNNKYKDITRLITCFSVIFFFSCRSIFFRYFFH